MSTLHLGFGGPLPKWPREAASRGPIAEGERETFVFLMLNELAQSGQVNAHNFKYETVALARECESFVKDSGLVPEHLQHPLPARQGACGRSVRQGAR